MQGTRRAEFLPFGRPDIRDPEIREVVETLKSGWLSTGPRVHRFEEAFREYVGSPYAIAVSSCTAALHLALDVLRVGQGDEVITTPLTFVSTANMIVHRAARPVLVDIDRATMNIDPDKIENAITPRTRVILPVHFAGRPCEMDRIMEIAEQNHLFVLEDAAHAAEAYYKGEKIGTIGHITAFSFYATKNICAGEGGMLTTKNNEWAEELRVKSLHGISKDAWKRYSKSGTQHYDVFYPGYKYNMMDIQAALGIHQLERVEENLKTREQYSQMYDNAFADLPEITLPQKITTTNTRHARHLYTILLRTERLKINRDEFVEALREENIGCGIHFTPIHLYKYYRETYGHRPGDFPNAEWVSERTISLPLSPWMTERDVTDVIEAVKGTLDRVRL